MRSGWQLLGRECIRHAHKNSVRCISPSGSCKTFVNSAFGYFYLVQMEIACTNPGASVKVLLHAGAGMRSVVPASAPKLQNVIACKL